MEYDPVRNVWRAADGRLWSSITMGPVTEDEASTAQWLERGGIPSTWPRDENGEQTQAALEAVLSSYGLVSEPAPEPAKPRSRRAARG